MNSYSYQQTEFEQIALIKDKMNENTEKKVANLVLTSIIMITMPNIALNPVGGLENNSVDHKHYILIY